MTFQLHQQGLDMLLEAMKARPRKLQPRDALVLLAVIRYLDLGGKALVSINQLAEDVAMQPSNVSLAISRLKKELLVVSRRDGRTGGRYFLPNPYLTSNTRQKQAYLWQLFQQAME